jgi:hypothetical protein
MCGTCEHLCFNDDPTRLQPWADCAKRYRSNSRPSVEQSRHEDAAFAAVRGNLQYDRKDVGVLLS